MTSEDTRASTRIETVGSYKIRQLPRSLKQIASDLGAKYVVVAQWAEGRRKPSARWKADLHTYTAKFGAKNTIAPEEWVERLGKVRADREVVKQGRKVGMSLLATVAAVAKKTTADDVIDEAGTLIKAVRSLRDEVTQQNEEEYGPSLSDRAKILSQCATMLDKAGKLTGVSAEISIARIVRSPAWGKLAFKMIQALAPWPDAMRALADMLKGEVEE